MYTVRIQYVLPSTLGAALAMLTNAAPARCSQLTAHCTATQCLGIQVTGVRQRSQEPFLVRAASYAVSRLVQGGWGSQLRNCWLPRTHPQALKAPFRGRGVRDKRWTAASGKGKK